MNIVRSSSFNPLLIGSSEFYGAAFGRYGRVRFQSPLDRVLRVFDNDLRDRIRTREFQSPLDRVLRVLGKANVTIRLHPFQSPLDRVLRVLQGRITEACRICFNPLLIGSSEF